MDIQKQKRQVNEILEEIRSRRELMNNWYSLPIDAKGLSHISIYAQVEKNYLWEGF